MLACILRASRALLTGAVTSVPCRDGCSWAPVLDGAFLPLGRPRETARVSADGLDAVVGGRVLGRSVAWVFIVFLCWVILLRAVWAAKPSLSLSSCCEPRESLK